MNGFSSETGLVQLHSIAIERTSFSRRRGAWSIAGGSRLLERYLKPDLLIINDIGMKQLPNGSGEYMFEIVMRRHEVKSTMMTSNWPIEDWGKLIGDVPSATAILDRFLHRSKAFQISG